MDEKLSYYENYLVPVLKKRVHDSQAIVSELEASVIYLNDKVARLEFEIKSIKNQSSDSVGGETYQ
jgi:hypothetical protein